MSKNLQLAVPEPVEPLLRVVRGERVIFDTDLARVYGVETKALNRAVKRNADRFPCDFVFQLTRAEAGSLTRISHHTPGATREGVASGVSG